MIQCLTCEVCFFDLLGTYVECDLVIIRIGFMNRVSTYAKGLPPEKRPHNQKNLPLQMKTTTVHLPHRLPDFHLLSSRAPHTTV